MFKKAILSVSAMLGLAGLSYAQLPCATDAHYQRLLKQYPQLAAYEQQLEEQTDAAIRTGAYRKMAAKTTSYVSDTTVYDVPLVIHVIHDYGTEYLSDDVLYDAVAHWTQVYMGHDPDTAGVIAPFKPYIGTARIRWHLATIDPAGKPTKGVVRFQSYLTRTADDQAKYNQWPQDKYVNVYFINTFGEAETGAAAYALLPSSAAHETQYDGVISLASYADYAKTIPHELGHVLNLQHPWGNTNNPDVACGDDRVDDTPPTRGHNPVGCVPAALFDTACATGYVKVYTAVGGADSVVNYPDTANSQNIMDYTYCQDMFTKGQVARMRTSLTGTTAGRNNLYSVANLAATGAIAPYPDLPPIADFSVQPAVGAGVVHDLRTYFLSFTNNASFVFYNRSWNDTISSIQWQFSNGASTPSSSSLTSVSNKFSVPGWVSATIIAASNAGTDTLVAPHAVYAADTTPVNPMSFTQQFTSAADVSNWPMFNYYNNAYQWGLYTGAGLGDNSCVRYKSYDATASGSKFTGNATGDFDDMYTPAFDLTGYTTSPFINFFTAGGSVSASAAGLNYGVTPVGDSMEVDISTSGGVRWTKLAGFKSADLANNGNYGYEFAPANAGQWKARGVNIPLADCVHNAFFRFRYYPGNLGNDLYMDNVYFDRFPAGIKEAIAKEDAFKVWPNPADGDFNISFKTGNENIFTCTVSDITGKKLYENTQASPAHTFQQVTVSRSVLPAAGMYLVTLTIDGNPQTQKLVVY